MYSYLVNRCNKTILIIQFFVLSVFLTPTLSLAALPSETSFQQFQNTVNRTQEIIGKNTNSIIQNGQVVSTVRTFATVEDGSRVGASTVVSKAADAAVAAKGIAGRLARATGPAILGSLAVDALFKAVDWVFDPKNNSVSYKQNTDNLFCNVNNNCNWLQQVWFGSSLSTQDASSPSFVAQAECNHYGWGTFDFGYFVNSSVYYAHCAGADRYATINAKTNNYYDSSALPPNITIIASNSEIQKKIQDYLIANSNTQIAQDVYKAAYNYDPNYDDYKAPAVVIGQDALTGVDAAVNNKTGVAEFDALDKDFKPTHVHTTFEDAPRVSTVSTTETPNPDGTKTTSTSTGSTQIPAFCSWAGILCDFVGWTKDQTEDKPITPDAPDTPIQLDLGQLDTTTFKATPGCPQPRHVQVQFSHAAKDLEISYEPVCQIAAKWSFVAPMIAFLSGAMIVIGVGRKNTDES